MKKTIKMNVVLALVLSMTLLFGATISANAAEVCYGRTCCNGVSYCNYSGIR